MVGQIIGRYVASGLSWVVAQKIRIQEIVPKCSASLKVITLFSLLLYKTCEILS